MLAQEELHGNWDDIKGRLQKQWGQLSGDDLECAKGNADQLVALVQHKTGESKEKITSFINDAANEDKSLTEKVKESSQQYASQAQDTANEYYQQAAETVSESYQQVQSTVRERPTESMALTFAAGMITGTILGIMLKTR